MYKYNSFYSQSNTANADNLFPFSQNQASQSRSKHLQKRHPPHHCEGCPEFSKRNRQPAGVREWRKHMARRTAKPVSETKVMKNKVEFTATHIAKLRWDPNRPPSWPDTIRRRHRSRCRQQKKGVRSTAEQTPASAPPP